MGSILDALPREGAVFAGRTGAVRLPDGRFLFVELGSARIVDSVSEPPENVVPAPPADIPVRRPAYMDGYAFTATSRRKSLEAAFRRLWADRDQPDNYVRNDPYTGGMIRVAQAIRRVVPETPVALSYRLAFGDPRDPEAAYQLKQAVQGIADAAQMFGLPVVAGELRTDANVALHPWVEVFAHGLEGVGTRPPARGQIVVVGRMTNDLSGSPLLGEAEGFPPPIDLIAEGRVLEVVRAVGGGVPIERGGLLITLARCCARARIGARVKLPEAWTSLSPEAILFGEAQSRFLMFPAQERLPELRAIGEPLAVPVEPLGTFGGPALSVDGIIELDLEDLV